MKNEFQCLDLVVQKLSNDPTPHGYSPPNGNPAPSLLPDREVDVEDVVVMPDAQSAQMRLEYVSMTLLLALRRPFDPKLSK
jgi:hypothetical protein